jgi:hypothetical protein
MEFIIHVLNVLTTQSPPVDPAIHCRSQNFDGFRLALVTVLGVSTRVLAVIMKKS